MMHTNKKPASGQNEKLQVIRLGTETGRCQFLASRRNVWDLRQLFGARTYSTFSIIRNLQQVHVVHCRQTDTRTQHADRQTNDARAAAMNGHTESVDVINYDLIGN